MPVLTTAQIHKQNLDPVTDPQLLLVEIEELHSGVVHRYVRDVDDLESSVSDGVTTETWTAASIEFSWTGHGEEIRDVNITVSNVYRDAGRALILSSEPIMVRLIVIDYASPNTAMADTLDLLFIGEATIGPETVEGKLTSTILWDSAYPFYRATKMLLPGIYA